MAPDPIQNESKSLFDSFGTLDEIDDSENYFEEKKPPTLPPLWLSQFYGFSGLFQNLTVRQKKLCVSFIKITRRIGRIIDFFL